MSVSQVVDPGDINALNPAFVAERADEANQLAGRGMSHSLTATSGNGHTMEQFGRGRRVGRHRLFGGGI